MKRHPFLAALLVMAAAAAFAQQKVDQVPQAFVGRWCGADLEERLEIKPNHISFYESRGPIKAITVHGDREVTLTSRLSGEGETWMNTVRFRLSRDGRQLIVVNADPPLVRRRCAK